MISAIYEGEKVELKAYMKMEDVKDGFIGLMLRIDGDSGILEFDNMMDKNIQGTSDWTQYTITLPYPKDAKSIMIGPILSGTGKLWVDNIELLIDGNDISVAKQKVQKIYKASLDTFFDKGSGITPFSPTDEQVNNLNVLGLVWGFLKYYHPMVAAGEYNWDYELFRIMPGILNAGDAKERDYMLGNWITSLGKFETDDKTELPQDEVKMMPDVEWITHSNLTRDLAGKLLGVRNAKRENENYYIGLVEGVQNPKFNNEKAYPEMKYPDAGFRLLSLFRYWNIIQYYFPYRNLIGEDWKGVLKEFIPKFVNAGSEIEYKLVALELIARVHDTHANIWGQDSALKKFRGVNYAPVGITFIENQAVVTDYFEQDLGEKSGLLIGDVITKINKQPVDKIIADNLKYAAASNYPTQLRDIARNLLRTNDTVLNLEIIRNGLSFPKEIHTFPSDKINLYSRFQRNDTCFRFITPDIGYIYPGTIKNEYVSEIMKGAENTKGLIIDMRCYPSEFIVYSLGSCLISQKTPFAKFSNASISTPGLFVMNPDVEIAGNEKDCYKGKVVILVNETTQSQAEYSTMAFRAVPGATVIGSTTAGADGDVSQFSLPGGISTMISGIGVYYPDGSETQRIDIIPDIEVEPTIEGIKLKKDELLGKAIEIIKQQ